jgi:hypothetical protein
MKKIGAAVARRVTLTADHGRLRAGMGGEIYEPPTTSGHRKEPAAWVFWDDKAEYPRWVPASKLGQA